MNKNNPLNNLLEDLKERAKELNCLYEVQELIQKSDSLDKEVFSGIIKAIPPGWQYPDICQIKIICNDQTYQSTDFEETPWILKAPIKIHNEPVGSINVFYLEERPQADEGPFLKEERRLINTIADHIGNHLLHEHLKVVFEERTKTDKEQKSEWWVILDLLKRTDPKLLMRITRKMVNFLCWSGFKEAEKFLEYFSPAYKEEFELLRESNQPYQMKTSADLLGISNDIFEVAAKYLNVQEVLDRIQKWIKEDKSAFLVNILENAGSSLSDINNAIERYHHLAPHGLELSETRRKSFRVALSRRLLSDQSDFVNIAKHFMEIDDFNQLMTRTIYSLDSNGKIGGKSAGLLLAERIIRKSEKNEELFQNIRVPKTWHLISDGLMDFISYNSLEDIVEQKYKSIEEVRQEYPYVVHVFKNSLFVPEIIKGLLQALDDFGESPLIIRSSSLLEDRMGAAFAGKYKSLFIANQGSKEKRLVDLMDAIAEVYASTFGPDPIEYRTEHGLLDYYEEMGIMIQEVVGKKIGRYFFPAFAGVAFSHNEFRWSSRIKKEDGLIRIVPGLGTRAVDRLSDDFPILISPGQPQLRVNVTIDEIIRYSPKNIDLINLETGSFETVKIRDLIKEIGSDYPAVHQIVSILQENRIQQPMAMGTDYEKEDMIVTFEGLSSRTPIVKQIHGLLIELQEKYAHPVDIEFAHDGENLYLLQCRSQSYAEHSKPALIPSNIPQEKILFTACRYISNGLAQNISHIVYVDPQKYSEIPEHQQLLDVGRIIGKLNQILPKHHFILMGPGRWGSRGDIKLGVNVTYSDINNTAVLIEIARKQKDYQPDLSFGTHFFQDLVEANIRYLPLYPDDNGIIFNEEFFNTSENILGKILPDFSDFEEVIKVIDVSAIASGEVLQIYMNADTEKAIGVLSAPSLTNDLEKSLIGTKEYQSKPEFHWRWRLRSAETIAARLDPQYFGVKAFYIFGSTKNSSAGAQSDIDILIHFQGSEKQREILLNWLEGWSYCLSQFNFLQTGTKSDGLLDVHLITDEDIKNRTSYAVKIGAVTDAARPIAIGTAVTKKIKD